nr:mechanosensitive ion channel [FCB group bacterium]
ALIATWVIYSIAKRILIFLEKSAHENTRWTIDEEIVRFLKTPVTRLILIIGLFYALNYLSTVFGEDYRKYVHGIFYILIVGQITLTLMRLVTFSSQIYTDKFIDRRMISGREEFFPLVVRVVKIIIFTIALIIVLKHFKQDVQSLVVSLGVGSLAIALAAQETLSNMIAGFVIMTDRPFRVGDRIKISSGETGDVYEIGLRSTKVMTFDNTLIIVPNAQIINEKVLNLTYPEPRTRVQVFVGVAYGTNIEKVKEILIDICNRNPKVLATPAPNAYFLNFGDSSLDFRATCHVSNWDQEWSTAEEIRLEIDRRFSEEGIVIPFPQRSVWFENKPPDESEDNSASPKGD